MFRFTFFLLLATCASAQNAATFQWIQQTDFTGFDSVTGFGVDAAGNSYIVGSTASSNFAVLNSLQTWSKPVDGGVYSYVFVTKVDPSGNVVYSTLFGGSGYDIASAMTVDSKGDVYVTGSTTSRDFPVTPGAYASSGGTFVFKLNADGSLGYSTYFAPAPTTPIPNVPAAIAVDLTGAVYLAGTSGGYLPVTAGAYQTNCSPPQPIGVNAVPFFLYCGFLSKLDPKASTLVYSTYVTPPQDGIYNPVTSLAVGSDASVYLGGVNGVFHLNAAGSALLASAAPTSVTVQALALAPDGTLYAAGHATSFPTTQGAYQTTAPAVPALQYEPEYAPAVIARWDSQLANVLEATYFGQGRTFSSVSSIAFDASGNIYLGGATDPQGVPTRTPLQLAFATNTGFVSELSGDLSRLLFSSYFGDTRLFSVAGVGVRSDGSVALGGLGSVPNGYIPAPGNPFVNSLALGAAPALRVDTIVNAASLLDGAISVGETIVVQGVGFGTNPQLTIGGMAVTAIATTPTSITATVPQGLSPGAAVVEVSSAGAVSNPVAVLVAPAAPAVFSQDGSGFGQGYVLNNDGTLNSPLNPAAPGEAISVFATGVGPINTVQGYAVSQYPVNVYLDTINCNGIEAFLGPVPGLPGNVYLIQVFVPAAAELIAVNPSLAQKYPPLVSLSIVVNNVASQNGIAFSIGQ